MKLAMISLGATSSRKIAKEAEEYFKEVDEFNLKNIEVHAGKETKILYKNKEIKDYDCVYIRGSYKYALLQRAITCALSKKAYLPLQEKAFTICHNKLLTVLELKKSNLPIPETYFAATTKEAKKIIKDIQYPIIIKIPSGTQGKGVMTADSPQSAKSVLDTLDTFNQPYLIQEFVETNATDIRAIVANNKVIATMKRKAKKGEIRANFHLGGTQEPYELDYDTEQITIKAANLVGADICAIDILEAKQPKIIEINTSPGLVAISRTTKKNLPKLIAKELYQKTKEFKKHQKQSDYSEILKELNINDKKEIITNLNIKAGMIKLPAIITKITEFNQDNEVAIYAEKGKLIIKKQ